MAFCVNCGNKMGEGAKFCASCGTRAAEAAGAGSNNMSPGKAVDEDAKKLFEEGIEYLDQRDAPKAIECFDAVIKLNPTYPYVWTWRGMAYMDDDRCETYAEALSDLNRAIEIDNSDGNAYGNRAFVNWRYGRKDEALKDLEASIHLNGCCFPAAELMLEDRVELPDHIIQLLKEEGYINDDDEDDSESDGKQRIETVQDRQKQIKLYDNKKREALMKQWSEPLRTKTYIEIADMLTCEYPAGELRWVIGTSLLPYACFKNINGKYGRMTVENASDNHHAPPDQCCYEITRSDGAKETFPSVDSLIDAGWVLD
ncbi:MAG: zinc-ribbon domain-containing protein [Treponema sp.]|jgi:tetratricopeptide (TPR) repeat protein|nr:zinc-ribbon domain-containing protein [Treponema sp.]